MGILNRLPSSSMVGRPIADYLNISVPFDHSEGLRSAVLPVLDSLGCFTETTPGLFVYHRIVVKKGNIGTETLGTVKFGRRGRVATLSTSGGVLRLLRESQALPEYLAAIASFPHRVTMLHATADFLCGDVPAVIHSVKEAAYAGDLALTRKRILPTQCQHVFSVDVDGKETGTVYLGQRVNADVWAKVYDKRHERLSRGFPDPGSICRVEIACMSDVGATLRDASDPYDIFFHFAGRSLVDAPVGLEGWLPHGEGYVLGERRERSLFDRFDQLIEGSLDIKRLASMAVELYGAEVAARVIGRRVLALVRSPSVKCPEYCI